MDKSVVHTVRSLEETGKKQYKDFLKKVLLERTTSIHDPIKRTSLALFKTPQSKILPKKGKMKVLQNNVALFGQLYIAMQNRQSDLNEFFAHEIQSFPPSLSDFGMLYLPGTKSDLLPCLGQSTKTEPPSTYNSKSWMDPLLFIACQPSTSAPST